MTLPADPPTPPTAPPTPPPTQTPPVNGHTPPAAAAPPPATPPAGDDPPQSDPKWLPSRLARERAAVLRELGYSDADAAKAAATELAQLKKDQEAARVAQLSEVERANDRAKKLEADLAQERAQRQTFERQSQLTSACAALGVKNTGYAAFLFNEARQADATITAEQALTHAMAHEHTRVALGAAPVPTVPVPTGPSAPPGVPPVPQSTNPGAPVDAFKMDDAAWAAQKAALGMR